jgi:hypothetical protein
MFYYEGGAASTCGMSVETVSHDPATKFSSAMLAVSLLPLAAQPANARTECCSP